MEGKFLVGPKLVHSGKHMWFCKSEKVRKGMIRQVFEEFTVLSKTWDSPEHRQYDTDRLDRSITLFGKWRVRKDISAEASRVSRI